MTSFYLILKKKCEAGVFDMDLLTGLPGDLIGKLGGVLDDLTDSVASSFVQAWIITEKKQDHCMQENKVEFHSSFWWSILG